MGLFKLPVVYQHSSSDCRT